MGTRPGRGSGAPPLALPARRPLRPRHGRVRTHTALRSAAQPRSALLPMPELLPCPLRVLPERRRGARNVRRAGADGRSGTAALHRQNFASGRAKGGEGPGAGGAGSSPDRSLAGWLSPRCTRAPSAAAAAACASRALCGAAQTLFRTRGKGGGTVGLERRPLALAAGAGSGAEGMRPLRSPGMRRGEGLWPRPVWTEKGRPAVEGAGGDQAMGMGVKGPRGQLVLESREIPTPTNITDLTATLLLSCLFKPRNILNTENQKKRALSKQDKALHKP